MMISAVTVNFTLTNSSKLAPQMRVLLLLGFLLVSGLVRAQDMDYAREVMKELCSDEFAGRGYVDDGDNAAAYFIEQEFKANDLFAWDFNYYQTFNVPVNRFPGKVELAVDGSPLLVGKDFHIESDAPSVRGKYELTYVDQLPKIAPVRKSGG